MTNAILIFSDHVSPRLQYTCHLVFSMHLGMEVAITSDILEFTGYNGPRLLYSKRVVENIISIEPDSLLFQNNVIRQTITPANYQGNKVPFATGGKTFPFDLFAAVFYLVSRYEEYLPFEKNQYGQFKATDSLAYQLGFLEQPVVDNWIAILKKELLKHYPGILLKEKTFSASFTYDIDVAYAYKGRSAQVTAANFFRDLLQFKISNIKERWNVLFNNSRDPFDSYTHILNLKKEFGHQVIFFFLLGEKNQYNHNLQPAEKILRDLITTIAVTELTGIHPSYYADTDAQLLAIEKKTLEAMIKTPVVNSRQHYLRLSFPATYRNLIQAGIEQDYTLGFAEMPGFRAGTCSAFYFYDLEKEKQTNLLLHPFTFMEGSFIEDMKMTAAAAFEKMKQLLEEVKKVNGHFITVWHNHTLSDKNEWKGLKAVHDEMAKITAATEN